MIIDITYTCTCRNIHNIVEAQPHIKLILRCAKNALHDIINNCCIDVTIHLSKAIGDFELRILHVPCYYMYAITVSPLTSWWIACCSDCKITITFLAIT